MPETEDQKRPEPDDQVDEHEDKPYLRRLPGDDLILITTDLD